MSAQTARWVPDRTVCAVIHASAATGAALDDFAVTVLALVAALPSASNLPMLAERFGAAAGRIAGIVLFATAASFVSFSAAVAWLI